MNQRKNKIKSDGNHKKSKLRSHAVKSYKKINIKELPEIENNNSEKKVYGENDELINHKYEHGLTVEEVKKNSHIDEHIERIRVEIQKLDEDYGEKKSNFYENDFKSNRDLDFKPKQAISFTNDLKEVDIENSSSNLSQITDNLDSLKFKKLNVTKINKIPAESNVAKIDKISTESNVKSPIGFVHKISDNLGDIDNPDDFVVSSSGLSNKHSRKSSNLTNGNVYNKKLPPLNENKLSQEKKKEDLNENSLVPIKVYQKEIKGDVLEKYSINLDGASAEIRIVKNDLSTNYMLSTAEISVATNALLNDLREELITMTSISMQELIDPKSFISIKNKFKEEALKLINKKIATMPLETSSFLVGILMQEMLGIGKIEYLINDPNLEEIVIVSAKEPLRVYTKKYGWLITNILLEKEETTINYANIIARRVGRQITTLNPLLDAHLVTGDRVNAVLYPINTKGNTIVIRKFARDPYTILDLITNKTCDLEIAALLWLAIEYEMNIIISGGTASGKTVLLNACMPFIPPNQRIISIEDTKELLLPDFLYWTPLVTRLANAEGKGAVTMIDLLINSLRMRPDRIILGEMRRREEAMVLFEAMHTGHSVYATLHADSAAETISRLTHPPLDIPPNLLGVINLNVVMFRDRRRGIRRVLQVAEIEVGGDSAKANTLYRWAVESDTIVKHSKSSKFFEDISRHTSMSEEEINKELQLKKKIMNWLISHKIRKLEDLGRTINLYYQNKDLLLKKIAKDDINFILNYEK